MWPRGAFGALGALLTRRPPPPAPPSARAHNLRKGPAASLRPKRCNWRICNEEARGFNVLPASPADADAVVACLRRSVYDEDPLIRAVGLRRRMSALMETLPLSCLAEGLSLMAAGRSRRVAKGALVACTLRYGEEPAPRVCEETRAAVGCRARSLLAFRAFCMREADVLGAAGASHALYVLFLGTVPKERRKGVASALLARGLEAARAGGFPLAVMQCSGGGSARRVAERCGMSEAWRVALGDFADERGKRVFRRAPPDTSLSVMVADLRDPSHLEASSHL